ncbi:hypothetical protein [Leptolyngbya sp. BC1307]|uniref:hypothetical protein n=1 Tax=Leptolyngbya sp. BC1307 TaxID=2029589 RepID=UPI001F0B5F15|nr:hypothetical protein [Leptolyngbya sp. BC1307]
MDLKPTVEAVAKPALSPQVPACESVDRSANISSQPRAQMGQIQGSQAQMGQAQNPARSQAQNNANHPRQPVSVRKPAGSREKGESGSARSDSAVLQVPKAGDWNFFGATVNQNLKVDEVVEKMDSGRLWVVNSRRRNGLIVLREFHAEFAGPGAAVGGDLDKDIVKVIPIGNLSLLAPDSQEAHQNAIKIRLQWIRLTQNFTDQPNPEDRAWMILEQFKTYFDQMTVDRVPDMAFAMLVGVLPQTIRRVRSGFV